MDAERTTLYRERALLVGVALGGDHNEEENLDELGRLAETAGVDVVGRMLQQRRAPAPTHFIGAGKVEEVAALAEEREADVVIFDVDLSPAQVRNLEKALDRKVVDRTEVILHIFAIHARSHAARLQVELAQLEYTYPRLRHMWSHLSRYEGGIGTRGPGERQIETDRRLVSRRIVELKRRIQEVAVRREQTVRARADEVAVSLVGYTNAGKSTLLNRFTGANVRVEDNLFVTLDTRTRRWPLSDGRAVLLSDTVGFVRKLPHHLVASFHATLEEARQADLLLHVADVSSPAVEHQVAAVKSVLEQLGCGDKPTLLLLNKSDRLADYGVVPLLRRDDPEALVISAHTGEGLNLVDQRLRAFLDARSLHLQVHMRPGNGRLQSFLGANAEIIHREYGHEDVRFEVRVSARLLGALRRLDAEIHDADDQPIGEPAARG